MNLSIAVRLAVGFGAVMLLSLGVSLYQMSSFHEAITFLELVTQRDLFAYREVVEIAHGRARLRAMRETAVIRSAIPGPDQQFSGERATLSQYRDTSQQVIAVMSELSAFARERSVDSLSDDRRIRWSRMAESVSHMMELERGIQAKGEALFTLVEQNRTAEAARVHYSTMTEYVGLDQQQALIEALIAEMTEIGRSEVQHVYKRTIETAIVAITVMLIAAATAAWAIGASIGGVLRRFMGFVQMVGQGDLTHMLPELAGGELSRMGAHLNGMRESLRTVATQTRAAAENVNAATAQIRTTAQEQAAVAAEQLSAIEETSATLTEITQSGAQITARAQEVERNAQDASGISDQGLTAVAATVASMDSIREQVESVASTIVSLSERTLAISEITLTVNTIAERSHLLALNASIEAAAAGEHGRTFTVVAGEIKRLADQAREATQRVRGNLGEILQGINSSVMLAEEAAKRVEAGRIQTEATDRTIRSMADAIQESVQAFQQIVAATNQHQIGLEQVMQALGSIRQAASQTSSTTRELEGAATNLNGLSEALVEAVRIYRL
ncbi:MAG: methyl-accepting chemotaxis protein [Rhodospirillaceae bacterium]|nr:methyl-accepting chemotaxis protein [Rhodospirillales bacterium]